jgi:hypothetical protein
MKLTVYDKRDKKRITLEQLHYLLDYYLHNVNCYNHTIGIITSEGFYIYLEPDKVNKFAHVNVCNEDNRILVKTKYHYLHDVRNMCTHWNWDYPELKYEIHIVDYL